MTQEEAYEIAELIPLPLVFGLRHQPVSTADGMRSRQSPTRGMVLRSLYAAGRASRADIARDTGLARGTVSQAVDALDREMLVIDTGRDPSKRPGKPSNLLALNTRHHVVMCISISEPHRWSVSAMTLAGVIEERRGGWTVADDLVPAVLDHCRELLSELQGRVACAAIAVPGMVDDRGHVMTSHLTGRSADLIAADLSEGWGLQTFVYNDANAAALAAHDFSSVSSTLLIRIGLGIGAGLVVDRRVVRGAHHSAGEIGKLRAWGSDGGTLNDRLSSGLLAKAQHDPRLSEELGGILGYAVAPIVATLDLGRVVVSGIGVEVTDGFLSAAEDAIDHSLLDADVGVNVLQGRSDGNDVIVGVAGLAFSAWLEID